jgi:ubiquinone/menaquinone biosynthesis C-methylase UbiE
MPFPRRLPSALAAQALPSALAAQALPSALAAQALPSALAAVLLLLAACDQPLTGQGQSPPETAPGEEAALVFPRPDRPVAPIVSDQYSDEASRDREGEAALVLQLLEVRPGLRVADIGAGRGYYTVRLAPAVGATGIVFANDVLAPVLSRLNERVIREGLANVRPILGAPGNANLPPASIDLALMVHMYHEIEDPYGLLWHLHRQLRSGGRVAILENDRPTRLHGTPPALLQCELEQAGFQQTTFHELPTGSYLAVFEPTTRPAPEDITPCAA